MEINLTKLKNLGYIVVNTTSLQGDDILMVSRNSQPSERLRELVNSVCTDRDYTETESDQVYIALFQGMAQIDLKRCTR